MYQFTYAEVVDDSPQEMRARERDALVALRRHARIRAKNRRRNRARLMRRSTYLRRLWTIFIEDLGSDGNDLPEDLRAQLISIGIWMMKEIERLRTGAQDCFDDLIEINAIIRDGLA